MMASSLGFLNKMASDLLPFESSSWTLFAAPTIACCIILIWRLWRFSLAPTHIPNDPEQLPYWIPCTSISSLTHDEKQDSNIS